MIVEKKDNEKITVSFSAKVGNKGLNRIKSFIEFLEKSGVPKKKKVPQSIINKLADEVNEAAWERFKKAKGIK